MMEEPNNDDPPGFRFPSEDKQEKINSAINELNDTVEEIFQKYNMVSERDLFVNFIQHYPEQFSQAMGDLSLALGTYAYFDEDKFKQVYSEYRKHFPDWPKSDLISDYERRLRLFTEISKKGFLYFSLIKNRISRLEKNGYTITYSDHPDIILWVLSEFRRVLITFERNLKDFNTGEVKLHLGWYWFNRYLALLTKNEGEAAAYSLIESYKEDIESYGEDNAGLAAQELDQIKYHLKRMINDVDNEAIPLHNSDIIENLEEIFNELDRLGALNDVMYTSNNRDIHQSFISMSYGLGFATNKPYEDQLFNNAVNNTFRAYFSLFESIIKSITFNVPDFNRLNYTWKSLGSLNRRNGNLTPIERNNNNLPNPLQMFTDLYNSYNVDVSIEDSAYDPFIDRSLNDQLIEIKRQINPQFYLQHQVNDTNPGYCIKIINRVRNLFLHTSVFFQGSLDLNERRKIIRLVIQYISFYANQFLTETNNLTE